MWKDTMPIKENVKEKTEGTSQPTVFLNLYLLTLFLNLENKLHPYGQRRGNLDTNT
jgi:hypothetical protein